MRASQAEAFTLVRHLRWRTVIRSPERRALEARPTFLQFLEFRSSVAAPVSVACSVSIRISNCRAVSSRGFRSHLLARIHQMTSTLRCPFAASERRNGTSSWRCWLEFPCSCRTSRGVIRQCAVASACCRVSREGAPHLHVICLHGVIP